jgi:hypothetical protein
MVIRRTWTAEDMCGNVTQISQLIVTDDETAPELIVATPEIWKWYGQMDNLVHMSDEELMQVLDNLNPTSILATDDCDVDIVPEMTMEATYAEDCEEAGYYERRTYTWVATDACGNSAELSFTVDIMDDVAPEFAHTPEDTLVICGELPPPAQVQATDNTGEVEVFFTEEQLPAEGFEDYIVIRTWTAVDGCGNRTSITQELYWIPNTEMECDIDVPEDIPCNTHGVVITGNVTGGIGPYTYNWEVLGNECFIQSGQNTETITIYVGFGEITINLTVTDAYGCSTFCTVTFDCLNKTELPVGNLSIDPVIRPFEGIDIQILDFESDREDNADDLEIWPNPTTDLFNVKYISQNQKEVTINVTNTLGEMIWVGEIDAIEGENMLQINVSNWQSGSYIAYFMTFDQTITRTMIITR